jgi:C-terminal regulatory domain of Threonine dehydratase
MWTEVQGLAEKFSGRKMILDIIFPEREGALSALLKVLPRGINIVAFNYQKHSGPLSPARIEFEGDAASLHRVPFLIKKAGFAYSEAE